MLNAFATTFSPVAYLRTLEIKADSHFWLPDPFAIRHITQIGLLPYPAVPRKIGFRHLTLHHRHWPVFIF